jgi:hypothetical protein
VVTASLPQLSELLQLEGRRSIRFFTQFREIEKELGYQLPAASYPLPAKDFGRPD